MIDKSQVIEKLKWAVTVYKKLNVIPVETGVIEDALEMLKDHEPRILTLGEVLASGDKLMWLQYKSVKTPEHYELYPTSPYNDDRADRMSIRFQSGHVQRRGLYGRQWRCWTEKPSVADAIDWEN